METVPAVEVASPPQAPAAAPTVAEQHEAKEGGTTTPALSPAPVASGTPLGTAPETTVASPSQNSGAQPTVAIQKQEEVTLSPVLGAIEVLSPAEQAELYACEEVVASGWQSFVQVGLALARIRDLGLYRTEFESFPAYCRAKWQYGRRYVNRLISAAQAFTHLGTISSPQKPEHETQVRPLVGLTPDQAQRAWEHAAQKAGSRKIAARLVKIAVNELGLAPQAQSGSAPVRTAKSERRLLITRTMGELLKLIGDKAGHDVLLEKARTLETHLSHLLGKK
jgi:hypothetical protein